MRVPQRKTIREGGKIMFIKKRFNELSCIKLCFTAAPFLTVLMLLDTAILVMSPLLKIYATAEFIDASIRLLSEEAPLTDALFPIAVVVLVSGYSYLEKSLRSIVAIRLTAKLRVIYGSMRMDKMAVVAYRNIEEPNVLELLKRTEDDGEIICKIYQSMLNAVVLLAQILSVFAAIMTASLLTGLIVLAVSLPLMKIAAKSGKREYDLEREEAACKRRYEYFYELLSGRESLEERTLFQYGPFVEKHMLKFYEMFRKKNIVVTIRNNMNVEGWFRQELMRNWKRKEECSGKCCRRRKSGICREKIPPLFPDRWYSFLYLLNQIIVWQE